MSQELVLMMHPTFGILALISSVWVFVEALNAREANYGRIRTASILTSCGWPISSAATGTSCSMEATRRS